MGLGRRLNDKAGLFSHDLCTNTHLAMTGSAALLQMLWVLPPLLPLLLLPVWWSSEGLKI